MKTFYKNASLPQNKEVYCYSNQYDKDDDHTEYQDLVSVINIFYGPGNY